MLDLQSLKNRTLKKIKKVSNRTILNYFMYFIGIYEKYDCFGTGMHALFKTPDEGCIKFVRKDL